MEIRITEEAWERLRTTWPSGKIFRISGEVVGGCGMNIEYSLYWDEPALGDQILRIEEVLIHIDPETIQYLDTPSLTIDYKTNQGYKLISPYQIVAYGLKIKERWGA